MRPGLAAFPSFRRFWTVPAVLLAVAAVPAGGEPPAFPDIPRQATACLIVRFGDFYRSPAGQAVLKNLQEASPRTVPELERYLGFPLSRVEVVTTAVTSADERGPETAAIIVDLNQPVPPADLLKSLAEGEKNRDGLPAGVYRMKGVADATVSVSGDRRFTIFTSERARSEYVELLLRRGPGALDEAVQLAAQKPVLALGFRTSDLMSDKPEARRLGAEGRVLLPLLETKVLTAQAVLDGHLKFDFRLDYADKGDAAKAEKALEGLRTLLSFEINRAIERTKQKGDRLGQQAAEAAGAAFKRAVVTRDGARVLVRGELEPRAALADLARNLADVFSPTGDAYAQHHLKQIGIALHNYNDAYGALPPAAICDKSGKPLLSWRVAILPFIEQNDLYQQFRLNEPWDSEHNKKLLAQMPDTFRTGSSPNAPAAVMPADGVPERARTPIRAFVGGGAGFELRKGMRIPADFPDGTSNTLLVAVATESVPWTKPEELTFDPKRPLPALERPMGKGPMVLMADGFARRLSSKIKPETLRLLIQRNDGMVPGPDAFDE